MQWRHYTMLLSRGADEGHPLLRQRIFSRAPTPPDLSRWPSAPTCTAMPNSDPHTSIRGTGVTEYFLRSRRSLRLDTREFHHLAPLLSFVGDEFAEILGRPREHGDS